MYKTFNLFCCVMLPPAATQVFNWHEERPGAEGQSDEGQSQSKERRRIRSDEWVTVTATRMREVDVEPVDYVLDISQEVFNKQLLASVLVVANTLGHVLKA